MSHVKVFLSRVFWRICISANPADHESVRINDPLEAAVYDVLSAWHRRWTSSKLHKTMKTTWSWDRPR